jgi:CNT family concentrative nucleoside transporter
MIATYALCGFANLGSIAIQIGGIGQISKTLVDGKEVSRRKDLSDLGLRAMIAGLLACYCTAAIAGLVAG